LASAEAVAERLRQTVQKNPLPRDGTAVAITVSIGIAEATLSLSGVNALVKMADRSSIRRRNRDAIASRTRSIRRFRVTGLPQNSPSIHPRDTGCTRPELTLICIP
jgi:GGDEF domain-containing protein